VYQIDSLAFLVILLSYNLTFFILECIEIKLLGLNYLRDIWNMIDMVKILFTFTYLLTWMIDSDLEESTVRGFAALSLFFTWCRLIGFFRAIQKTRYLIRMIIEIIYGIGPFMCIFMVWIIALTYCIMALRDMRFVDAW
jgi:hypothetical protein